MAKAKQNPYGSPAPVGVKVVRVGNGLHTHAMHPTTRIHMCQSGKNAGAKGGSGAFAAGKALELYESDSKYVTCYRCQKLMVANERKKS